MKLKRPYENGNIIGAKSKQNWNKTDVPIFSITSQHQFNQLIGYAMFINGGNGTVLYRGQNVLYDNLMPSGARNKVCVLEDALIEKIALDDELSPFLKLDNKEICGWKKYQDILIEAVLQHYGANTYCMDFVDNHWCALWFGLYHFNGLDTYSKRTDNGHLYVILYLADTNGASVRGVYIGEESYTVDLRKVLPSYFLRPTSQHGWIVRGRERMPNDFKNNVICIAEIKVEDAANWLGDGLLLEQQNFFPDYTIDQGYKVLLSRQKKSGVYRSGSSQILPPNTVKNYHYFNSFYCSSLSHLPHPIKDVSYPSGEKLKSLDSIVTLYALLLEKGWSENSSKDWNASNPCMHHSAPTALLVQDIFGGKILKYTRKGTSHYFNKIDGEYFDLTSSENTDHPYVQYATCTNEGISKKRTAEIQISKQTISDNIGLIFTKSD